MKNWIALGSFLIVVSAVTAFGQQKELRISAIPDENPQELLRIYTPFADYLSKEVGMPVKFTPVVDYPATVEGLSAGKLDMVWYGGLTSVQAARMAKGAKRVVMRKEDTEFKSQFITRKDTGVRELKDLKGKTFSFGNVASTSGHLMPRYYLVKAGINPEKDFSKFSFSGAHDATAAWVEAGRVDAGALNFLVWDKLVANKKVDTDKVHVF
ncbi:MAG TPA: phosphate/phosphite/phosphonate ABC transporter substrate-binding protein, partial [Candidatus Binatia bacterium]